MRPGRQIFKYLWGAAVTLSVLLLLVTIGMWVRSHSRNTELFYTTLNVDSVRVYGIACEQARAVVVVLTAPADLPVFGSHPPNLGWRLASSTPIGLDSVFVTHGPLERIGFGPVSGTVAGIRYGGASVPYFVLVLVSVPLPLIALRRWRRRRRAEREGLCRVCGYDLRASVSRCPECGTPFGSDASSVQ